MTKRKLLFNFFYPFANNSPANQARGVIEVLRRRFPDTRILEWNFCGSPCQSPFEPPLDADIHFFFDMSFRFFREAEDFFRSLKGAVIYGAIVPYLNRWTPIKWDEVDYQMVVGNVTRNRHKLAQIGYWVPLSLLKPEKCKVPLALIDHWRRGHPEDTAGELESTKNHTLANYEIIRRVLSDLHIPFVELGKHNSDYTQEQIFDLYRRCHFYFLTFFECFGLPILENAIAGNWVFAPTSKWLGEPLLQKCPTFFSWEWDQLRLKEKLAEEKENILKNHEDYCRRWYEVNQLWYREYFRHEDRIVEVVEACLKKKRKVQNKNSEKNRGTG